MVQTFDLHVALDSSPGDANKRRCAKQLHTGPHLGHKMLLGWGICPVFNMIGFFQLLQKGTEAACPTEEPERKAANPTYPFLPIGSDRVSKVGKV